MVFGCFFLKSAPNWGGSGCPFGTFGGLPKEIGDPDAEGDTNDDKAVEADPSDPWACPSRAESIERLVLRI